MSVKIAALEAENVKRIKAVALTPSPTGLTIVGGNNNQGKTSVLDALAWALGGEKFRPTAAVRDVALAPPHLKVILSNGVVVERRGKNSSLTVTDPTGQRSGQQLLNAFVEPLALDLPRFMQASDKDKADTLLNIIGVGDALTGLDREIKALYDRRTVIGQIGAQKRHAAEELTEYPDAPSEPVSAIELIQQQQEILLHNADNQRKRMKLAQLEEQEKQLGRRVQELSQELEMVEHQLTAVQQDVQDATKTVAQLQDESTAELEQSIRNVEEINRQVSANLAKSKAQDGRALCAGMHRPDGADQGKAHRPHGPAERRRPAPDRPGCGGRQPDLQRQALAGHERQRPAAGGHRHCAPPEPRLRLCAAGQAGTDGPCHPGGVRQLAADRRITGHRHPRFDRRGVPDHH